MSSSRAVVTARDAARPGNDADDVAAAKLVFRRSLEDVVEAAIKRVLRSSKAVMASGEAQALRDENRQLVAALAEVKRTDDREIARLWELIEDLEVELAQQAAAIAAEDAPPTSPGALHAALEGTRQQRAALREAQRRVGALEAEAQALLRQQAAGAEEAAGLREQVRELKRQLRKQAKRAASLAVAGEDAEEGELAPSPPSAADQLRPLLESLRQQVVGSVMSELQAGLWPQMRQEIVAAVGAALPPQQPAVPGGQGAGSTSQQAQPQADPLQQLAAAVAAAAAAVPASGAGAPSVAPPQPSATAGAGSEPATADAAALAEEAAPPAEELGQLQKDEAQQREREAQFLVHQNRLLSILPPAVMPTLAPKTTGIMEALRVAKERLVCPPCQATFPTEEALLRHYISPKHLEVASYVYRCYTGHLPTTTAKRTKVQPRVPLTAQQLAMYGACFVCEKNLCAPQFLQHLASNAHVKKVTARLQKDFGYVPGAAAAAATAASSEQPPAKKAKLG